MSIQLKRSAVASINQNYVLADGQIGIAKLPATGTRYMNGPILKIGNGSSKWSELPYINPLFRNNPNDGNYEAKYYEATDSSYLSAMSGMECLMPSSIVFTYEGTNSYYWGHVTSLGSIVVAANNGTAQLRASDASHNSGNSSELSWRSEGVLVGTSYGALSAATLGMSYFYWKALYATTGTIQTSDKSAKHDIHYLSEGQTTTVDEQGNAVQGIDLSDIIEFVNSIEPATFIYNTSEDATPGPELRQLGLIADDIEQTRLFPYVGGRWDWDTIPADYDDDKCIQEEIPAGSTLALQPIPLAVTALTACKYLLHRNEILEDRLDTLERKLA